MAAKLPKSTLQELDNLMVVLRRGSAEEREAAMTRLHDFEKGGKLPVAALIDMAGESDPTLSMYAIGALGRNGSAQAVSTLSELAERHRAGNVLMLETIVDALGHTGDRGAAPMLLSLLGIQLKGWTSKLFGRRGKKKDDGTPEAAKRREHLALPVIRALEKLHEPRAVEVLGDFLEHPDPIVRWHMIQLLVVNNWNGFNGRLERMAESDQDELVRDMAGIALRKIQALPPHMNN
ncbi:MAG: HEAT repeat domain-containing protein [Candidatus Lambdaproteobacteria bacterium]|nr:HEAT repeat domain-containing protein [Candidatus Lambdaproteobacteria bacterium]